MPGRSTDSAIREFTRKYPNTVRHRGETFQLVRVIGVGSFGAVAEFVDAAGASYAVKFELQQEHEQVRREAETLQYLASNGMLELHYIPRIFFSDKVGTINYMVMEMMGEDLEMYRHHFPHNQLPGHLGITMAVQTTMIFQRLHDLNVIHRDVKPQNIVFGPLRSEYQGRLALIDFGMRTSWRDRVGHIPPRPDQEVMGTMRYLSSHVHQGVTPSRRDDMISLFYVIIYLMAGRLPWQESEDADLRRLKTSNGSTEDQHRHIARRKIEYGAYRLCRELRVHSVFAGCLALLLALGYDDDPPYGMIIDLLRSAQVSMESPTMVISETDGRVQTPNVFLRAR